MKTFTFFSVYNFLFFIGSRVLKCSLIFCFFLSSSSLFGQQGIGTVLSHTKISSTQGNFSGNLSNNHRFGRGFAYLGDMDGDGIPDMVVGAQNDNAVYVLFLNANGTVKSHQKISQNIGGFTGNLNFQDQFGSGLTAIGDLSGNGVMDIAVGAGQDKQAGHNYGAVYVLFMNADGTVSSHNKITQGMGGFTGNLSMNGYFGKFATAADINNDGTHELIVSAYNAGANSRGLIYVLFLDSTGNVTSHQQIGQGVGGFTDILSPHDNFGYNIAAIGDVDGDGVPDLAVGARSHEGTGAVWILFMNPDGTVKSQQKISGTSGNFTGTLTPGGYFGTPAALGDINGNGIPDILVGAELSNDGGNNKGEAWILMLTDSGTVKAHQKINETHGNFQGTLNNDDRFGSGALALGDINNNGALEVAVGARGDNDGGSNRGAVYILSLKYQSLGLFKTHNPCHSDCVGTAKVTHVSGVPPYAYVWSNGMTGDSISGLCAGTYSVTVYDSQMDTVTGSVTINEPPPIHIDAGNDITLCDGGCASLSATASGGSGSALFYFWEGGLGMGQNKTVCPTTQTNYIVYAFNADGCYSEPDTVTVMVSQTPTVSFSGLDAAYCPDDAPVTLSGSPSGGTFSGNGISGSTFDPAAAGPGTHSITYSYTNAEGCSDQETQTVLVQNFPSVSFSGLAADYCDNEPPVTLTGSPSGGTFSGDGISGNTFNPANVTGSNATVTYHYTDSLGCSNSTDQTTLVNNSPVANAGSDVVIPFNTNITLTGSASGGSGQFSYSWQPASQLFYASVQHPTTLNLNNTTVFTLTVTDLATGCTEKDSVTVFVAGGQLNITASGSPTTICQGDSAQLQVIASGGDGNYAYNWTDNHGTFSSSSQTPVVAPDTATTYTVTVISGSDTASQSVIINVSPIPQPAFSSLPVSICEDHGNVALSALPSGGTFSGNGVSGTSFDPVSAGAGSHILEYQYTNSYGCTGTDHHTITVNALPAVQISGLQNSFCLDEPTVNVSASPQGGTFSGNGMSGSLFNPAAAGSGTHSLTYTYVDNNGCSNNAWENVTVHELPVADAGPNKTLPCTLDAITVGAPPITGYSYLWTPSAGLNADNIANPQASHYDTITYLLTVTSNQTGCVNHDTVTVSPQPRVYASTSNDTTICQGDTVTVAAFGGASYLWSNGSTNDWVNVSPQTTTQYVVTVTNNYNCSQQDTVNVTVLPTPNLTLPPDQSICHGETVTLTASGGYTYHWDNGSQDSSITVSPNSTSAYSVTATHPSGCTAHGQINVTVFPKVITGLYTDTTVCQGDNLQIFTSQQFPDYQWSTGSNADTLYLSSLDSSAQYGVTVTDNNGCQASDTVMVHVLPHINGSVSPDTALCQGETVTLEALGGTEYLWSNGVQTAQNPVKPMSGTSYFVTISQPGHCYYHDSVHVEVYPRPFVWLGPDTIMGSGHIHTLDAGSGFDQYLWHDGSTNQTYVVNGQQLGQGTYTFGVWVMDSMGCIGGDTIKIGIFTGIEDHAATQIQVFPNPAREKLFIQFGQWRKEVNVEIIDINGRLHQKTKIVPRANETGHINIKHLANGVYALRIHLGDTVVVKRFVKK